MKIKFLSTGNSPDYYNFDGEEVTAYKDGEQESFDLSDIEEGDKFEGIEPETLNKMSGNHIIRDAYRDSNGELHVTLCQEVGPGHWGESEEVDSDDYDPDEIHVEYKSKNHAGMPWALTRRGKTYHLESDDGSLTVEYEVE